MFRPKRRVQTPRFRLELDAFLSNLELAERRRWDASIRRLKTTAGVKHWARSARKWLVAGHGGFPGRTLLRPETVGVVSRRGYRIEKILFQSRPNYFVPALFYVPRHVEPPFPGVVWACGHYPEAKAHPDYQGMASALALRGFCVCTIDPFGQGERGEYTDFESGVNVAGCPVGSHHYAYKPSLLLGRNAIHYRSWDKMRAIDLLCSRPDVDESRIGFAGHSGGGQMTYLTCGLDDRIKAAAISSGSGSCEHPHFRPSVRGPFHIADNLGYAAPFIPKPLLIMIGETERVYLDRLQKHEKHFRRFYRLFHKADHFRVVINDGGHDLDGSRRELICDWLSRWLEPAGARHHRELSPLPASRLWCTRTGNTLTSLKTETVVTLNAKGIRGFASQRRVPQTCQALRQRQRGFRARLRGLLALPQSSGRLSPKTLGMSVEGCHKMERLAFVGEHGRHVPAVLRVPVDKSGPRPVVILADDRGKDAASLAAQALCALGHGVAVLSLDMAGIGEAAPPPSEMVRDHPMLSSPQTNLATRSLDLSRPLMGLRVNDLLRAVDFAQKRTSLKAKRVFIVGIGSGALCAACAGALDPRIAGVCAADLLMNYSGMVTNRFTSGTYLEDFIPRILQYGDISDIMACIAPRPLAVLGLRDHLGRRVAAPGRRKAMAPVRRAYRLLHAGKAFRSWTGAPDQRRWSMCMAGKWVAGLLEDLKG